MERNVQIRPGIRGAVRFFLLLLVFVAGLYIAGCSKVPEYEQAYSFSERAENFVQESADGQARAFAADLSVITGEDDSDPVLAAEAAGVFEISGGESLFHKNATERMNPASTTKIMTAILALKYGSLDDMVTVGDEVIINESGSSMCGVKPGDTLSLRDLLYGLMIPSGNDAANAIAVHMTGSVEAFADMMNNEARQLGATGTHFANANGLTDPDHYTTAYDLYLMFHEALKNPLFRDIIGAQSHTAQYTDSSGQAKTFTWTVGNYYMNGKRDTPQGLKVFGGKTGTTKAAGYCLVMGSEADDGREYISVVMKAESRDQLYDNMTKIITKIVN